MHICARLITNISSGVLFVLHHFLPVVSLLDEQIFVGGVGLEPTCPLGSGFTGRRANQIAQSAQNFCRFKRVPTFSVGYHLCVARLPAIAFQMRAPLSYKIIRTNGVLGPCFGSFLFLA